MCPQWNEFFRVSVCHYAKVLSFRIKDQDELGTEMVGEVNIPVEDLLKKPNLSIIGMYFFPKVLHMITRLRNSKMLLLTDENSSKFAIFRVVISSSINLF